ncbi:MAG: L-serine ammonia-lyase, iron-sulfur-dependent, subunit alpha, partial [Ruminococcus sp.]|nr:L-serine ammonia-lyase, iron-sulfur-dependent, subunit alpha [Ruminococcus sp.]
MMVSYYPEFFNDVFGPIMQPGSSSHTAGPCRIGYLAHQLLKSKLKSIKVELDKNGSFAGTFGHMNEDLGMLSGAYGFLPDDERMFEIKEILKNENIDYVFEYTDFPKNSHPNAVKFILTDINNKTVTLVGNSTGGGMVETVEIMGEPYSF